MGLANLSVLHAAPLFQNLVSQKQVEDPVFSFKLAENGSELTIGGVNENLFTGDFTDVPVTNLTTVDPQFLPFSRLLFA
jgi:hypothetical protein